MEDDLQVWQDSNPNENKIYREGKGIIRDKTKQKCRNRIFPMLEFYHLCYHLLNYTLNQILQ